MIFKFTNNICVVYGSIQAGSKHYFTKFFDIKKINIPPAKIPGFPTGHANFRFNARLT